MDCDPNRRYDIAIEDEELQVNRTRQYLPFLSDGHRQNHLLWAKGLYGGREYSGLTAAVWPWRRQSNTVLRPVRWLGGVTALEEGRGVSSFISVLLGLYPASRNE